MRPPLAGPEEPRQQKMAQVIGLFDRKTARVEASKAHTERVGVS
jgi:hypothetical protein